MQFEKPLAEVVRLYTYSSTAEAERIPKQKTHTHTTQNDTKHIPTKKRMHGELFFLSIQGSHSRQTNAVYDAAMIRWLGGQLGYDHVHPSFCQPGHASPAVKQCRELGIDG